MNANQSKPEHYDQSQQTKASAANQSNLKRWENAIGVKRGKTARISQVTIGLRCAPDWLKDTASSLWMVRAAFTSFEKSIRTQ